MITLLIMLAVIGLICLAGIGHFIKKHGFGTLLLRFAFGHHMDGQRRTNATYFKRGDTIMHPTGRASRYAHRAHIERAAIRHTTWMITGLVTYGIFVAEMLTIVTFTSFTLAIVGLNGKRIERKYQARWVTRSTIAPLAQATAIQLNMTPQMAQKSISINSDYVNSKGMEKVGTIILPDTFMATSMQKDMLTTLIKNRLGIELTFQWHTDKHPGYLDMFRAPIPPKLVSFADKRSVMDSLNDSKVLLGTDGRHVDHFWDISSEEPHMACQASSRRGKTRLLLLIASQILNKGGSIYALDPKRVGIRDTLAGVPNVTIWDDPKDIQGSFDVISEVVNLLNSRIDEYESDRTVQFSRALLIIDEMSMYAAMAKRYWLKTKPKKAPAKPPLWDDIAELTYMAAFVKINIIIMGQRLDQRNMEGLLESMGTRMAAGWTRQSYTRFIGQYSTPVSSKIRGRFLLSDGESTNIIQCVLGSDIELREYAMQSKLIKPTIVEILEVNEARNV